MKNKRRNRCLLIILIVLIAVFSMQYMIKSADMENRKTVAVILPGDGSSDYSGVMDGIRDYAMNHDILLDVWYKDSMSLHELEVWISDEEKNHAIGGLLVYPEKYIRHDMNETYEFENVLAVTDTMKEQFLHTATFEECNEEVCSVPLTGNVIEQLTEDKDRVVYIKNTYKLGYCSMEQMLQSVQRGSLENISLEYTRVDGTIIADGSIDFLLTE